MEYDLSNRLRSIGNQQVSYDLHGRVERFGKAGISYNYLGKVERINAPEETVSLELQN